MLNRVLICVSILLSGCSTVVDKIAEIPKEVQKKQDQSQRQVTISTDKVSPIPGDPFYAPIDPSPMPEPIVVTGSIFNAETSRSLYSYTPPFAIGDSITVLLDENATASKSASSNLTRESNFDLDPITVPGGAMTINGKVLELGMAQTQDFDGNADAEQQHSLSARITVTVVDILHNHNLVVRGEKWLVINNGKEYMRFTGIIRPLDVSEDNSVQSYQVADSRIEFSGTGDQADVQTQGWLTSFLGGSLWPI